MKVKNQYIRIVIGSFIPILIFAGLSFIDAYYIHVNKNFNIVFLLVYGYIIMSIPLLIYSFTINMILEKKDCIICILIFSIFCGSILTVIPTFLDNGVSITLNSQYFYFNLMIVLITSIASGAFLYKLHA